jgi:UDP-N-acetylmuramyl pentapeptide phosphotransferase/UDP-N-acetylglucosamine-1-phosphate transferase
MNETSWLFIYWKFITTGLIIVSIITLLLTLWAFRKYFKSKNIVNQVDDSPYMHKKNGPIG